MTERMRRHADAGLIPVERLEDIPRFKNEDEEAVFWATHSLGEGMRRYMRPVAPDEPGLPPVRMRTRCMTCADARDQRMRTKC